MRKRRDETGASLVEVALVVPLLLTLAIGLAEIGFLVIDYITVTNAARSGARTGASLTTEPTVDDDILDVVEEDLCNLRYGDVTGIQIYKADPADGSMPDPVSSGLVNSYIPSGSLNCDAAGHSFVCDPMLSCSWDPASRDNVPPGFDSLGVHIEFTHNYVTDFIPFSSIDFTEDAIMQLEPDTSVGST